MCSLLYYPESYNFTQNYHFAGGNVKSGTTMKELKIMNMLTGLQEHSHILVIKTVVQSSWWALSPPLLYLTMSTKLYPEQSPGLVGCKENITCDKMSLAINWYYWP